MSKLLLFLAVSILPCAVLALGPHEVLVLANDGSTNSVRIAKEFVKLRQVPEENLVLIHGPGRAGETPESISPEEFTKQIWVPALRAAKERGIENHILAWVYSTDFPTRINMGDSAFCNISVQGLTFLRNHLPAQSAVSNGTYSSELFAGPNGPDSIPYRSETFDVFASWLNEDMPLPSMMLGHTGRNGTSVDTVIKCLETGLSSDGTMPSGTVFFVTTDDATRSRCREWQYPKAKLQLASMGAKAVITDKFPENVSDVMGLMTGAENVNPVRGNTYLPGCMAEHLTSAAGIFDSDGQTKLSVWIAAGATASAGTVTEPFANWTKFPSAHFFVHYAAGCTMIESFYQSIRCPLQLVIVGDPLAQPWAPMATLKISGVPRGAAFGVLKLKAEVKSLSGEYYSKCFYFLDGKFVGTGWDISLDTTKSSNGVHTFRAVAYRSGTVRCQAFAEARIEVGNAGKRAESQGR